MSYTHTDTDIPVEGRYPKLVRDRIPELVEADGKTVDVIRVTDPKQLLGFLLAKVVEESTELSEAEGREHQLEEIADVREVLGKIQALIGVTDEELEEVRASKRSERGGFEDGIVMNSKPEPKLG